ncbi:hypothetical protein QJS10_CPB11g00509 [Acorus calamus]|uniref:Uncharacterized protein n=1 Tax=Acorus calamus TaxID=4465 RepID=A0AAV9DRR4_ACOCL|nr:hypothetical protein QJS10_CPB11g00509 [Acorus calamus]
MGESWRTTERLAKVAMMWKRGRGAGRGVMVVEVLELEMVLVSVVELTFDGGVSDGTKERTYVHIDKARARPLEFLIRGDWVPALPRHHGPRERHQIPVPAPDPWTPTNTETDPARESQLLEEMQNTMNNVKFSRFYLHVDQQLEASHPLQDPLNNKILSVQGSKPTMVAYGVGPIESDPQPRLQLSIAILLARHLGIHRLELNRTAMLGKSFRASSDLGMESLAARARDEVRVARGLAWDAQRVLKAAARVVLQWLKSAPVVGVGPFLMEAGERLAMEVRVGGEDDWEEDFALAFRGLSWHLFELDPDVDLRTDRTRFVCDDRERVSPDLYDDCERVMQGDFKEISFC